MICKKHPLKPRTGNESSAVPQENYEQEKKGCRAGIRSRLSAERCAGHLGTGGEKRNWEPKICAGKNTKCGALAREAPPAQKNDHGKAGRLADTDGREMNLAGKSAHG
jgi:hypothetical protein